MKIFADTDVVIYLVEKHPDFRTMALAALSDLQTGPLVTCAMVRLETLTKPTKNNDHVLLHDYHRFYHAGCQSWPITETTFDLALILRAKHRLKSPDAINLACAIQSGCDVFLMHDRDYKTVTEIRIVSIRNYATP